MRVPVWTETGNIIIQKTAGNRRKANITGLNRMDEKLILELSEIVKTYGNTTANDHINLSVFQGDVLGLVGANGAGKSTLMRIVSGVTKPDEGTIRFDGEEIDIRSFLPSIAGRMGIHVAYQELSLCGNLAVYENFYVELKTLFQGGGSWRKKAMDLAERVLNEVFPGNGIDVRSELASLSIAQQQMVEIARACADPNAKLLILDEPTSSLPIEQTQQLLSYIRKKAQEGITFIYITHRLFEIMSVTNRIYVLKNGQVVFNCYTADTSEEELIHKMGDESAAVKEEQSIDQEKEQYKERVVNPDIYVKCDSLNSAGLNDLSCEMYGGEIIGISGLEGNGQKDLIHAIFSARGELKKRIRKRGSVAYVTGDRKAEGNFPLWSIAENISITALMRKKLLAINSPSKVIEQSEGWYNRLKIKGESPGSPMMSLSGGNQQKVLIARALQSSADIIILDDPTRGVDVETKRQLYTVFQEAADEGKLVIWYSSDDSELNICTKVLVMRFGSIVKTLKHDEISKDSIVEASFKAVEKKSASVDQNKRRIRMPIFALPMAVMVVMYLCCGILRRNTLSLFGLELLLSSAIPLMLAALSQTYIIGMSDVNLSIGNYMGFVCVMTATIVYETPALGILILLGGWILYGFVGVIVRRLNLPAVIVTLGFSFVWYGISLIRLQAPGGKCPQILLDIFNGKVLNIPNVFIIPVAAIALATFIYRSRYGTVLRGFGNNETAMIRSGWNRYKASFTAYFIAGLFAMMGGLTFTAMTGSADAGSMDSYTMLTVASVILGGGEFSGGRVNHLGAACGAVTLSLVTVLLGFLHVSSDYTSAVNGLMLIIILSFRLLRREGGQK